MKGNDIAPYEFVTQATMWEGVLASPPSSKRRKFWFKLNEGINDWEKAIPLWTTNELPVKSLYDCTNRLSIGTDVFTFLHPDAVEPIYSWLNRKGITAPVYWYPDVLALEEDLRINRAIKVIYTADSDDAKVLGLRSMVVSPNAAWRL